MAVLAPYTISLNQRISVKLTEAGREHFVKNAEAHGIPEALCRNTLKNKQEGDGWYQFRLWEFMEIFGPEMNLGRSKPNLFEDSIRIVSYR